MKEKKENYVKPQSYAIETEQSLMETVSIGISTEVENKPGRLGVRRYEDYEEEEGDDWSE